MTNTYSPNILLVEDSPVMALLVQRHLQAIFPCTIVHVITISDAKQQLIDFQFDMIISDVILPGGETGIDFLKYVRKDQRFHKIKFYVITAYEASHIKNEAFKLQCNGFLYKPFTRDQFQEMLKHE